MMKTKLIYVLCLLSMLSCQKEKIDSSDFYLEVRNFVEEKTYTFDKEQTIYLWATKSWMDKTISEVEYYVDESIIEKYNKENNTHLKLLPKSCYREEQTSFKISDADRNAKFKVYYSPEKIIESGGKYGEMEYALPYRIKVNGIPLDDKYGTVLVGFRVYTPYIVLEESEQMGFITVSDPTMEQQVTVTLKSNTENRWNVKMDFRTTSALVDEYNQAHGTHLHALEPGAFSWEADDAILEKGKTEKKVSFYVDLSKIKPGSTLLPIELSGLTEGFKIDEKQNKKFFKFTYMPRIPQSEWTVDSYSSTDDYEGGKPEYIIDNDISSPASFWHVGFGAPLPQSIVIKLKTEGKTAEISGIDLYNRQVNMAAAGAKKAEIWLSVNGTDWTKAATHQFMKGENGKASREVQTILFEPTLARYVKLNITERYDLGIAFQEMYVKGIFRE